MKSIKIVLITLLTSPTVYPINPFTLLKQGGDWAYRNTTGYIDISETYHPVTKQYLEKLYKKYPAEFQDTSSYILPHSGPAATFQSIYFPIYWAEKIELEHQLNKKDGLFTQATEWIALHEAGHVKNNDAANAVIGLGSGFGLKSLSDYYDPKLKVGEKAARLIKTITKNPTKTVKTLVGVYAASTAYWTWREYRADQFATEHCQSPEAVAAAYEILERQAPAGIVPGIMHSFKGFRLKRIAQAYEKKFGHPIPKTYHATDRVTA